MFQLSNLEYRIQQYHPKSNVTIGTGQGSNLLVVQPHRKFPERDSITGALNRFGILDDSYRTSIDIVDLESDEVNFYYLKELIGLLKPFMVVVCGPEVMGRIRGRKVNNFNRHTGKTFTTKRLPGVTLYAALNPMDYGFARASADLKQQGLKEWEELSDLLNKEKKKAEKQRWAVE